MIPRSVDANVVVGQLCVRHPLALPVLGRHGIDPGSSQTLAACCAIAGVDLGQVRREVRAAEDQLVAMLPPAISELIDHIIATYHEPAAARFAAVLAALVVARPEHDETVRAWAEVRDRVEELRVELELHMAKEERVLFPWLRSRAETAAAPIRAMQLEHADTIALLVAIVAAVRRWRAVARPAPDDATLRMLVAFEAWLCEHLYLENHVLFVRALERDRP